MYIINGIEYIKTANAFESDLIIYERLNTRAFAIKTYLKLKNELLHKNKDNRKYN